MSQDRMLMWLIFIIAVIGLVLGSVAVADRYENIFFISNPSSGNITHKSGLGFYVFQLETLKQWDEVKAAITAAKGKATPALKKAVERALKANGKAPPNLPYGRVGIYTYWPQALSFTLPAF